MRPDLPVYLAAIGPKNVALAAETADRWLPTFYSPLHPEVFRGSVEYTGWCRADYGSVPGICHFGQVHPADGEGPHGHA